MNKPKLEIYINGKKLTDNDYTIQNDILTTDRGDIIESTTLVLKEGICKKLKSITYCKNPKKMKYADKR